MREHTCPCDRPRTRTITHTCAHASAQHARAHNSDGFTRAEAEEFVRTSLALAMARDGSSGGVIRTVTITQGGAERSLVLPTDIPKLWDEHVAGSASQGVVI